MVDAIRAARASGRVPKTLTLVLAGVDRGLAANLCARAEEVGAADQIVPLGPVSDVMLDSLYRYATALVYPSVYEGFGLPVLEAMVRGTPVVAARAAATPEVLGDAGILLDPHDAPSWADAIATIVADERKRAAMGAAGRARAAGFTWERTARTTLGVYRRVAAPA